MNFYETQMGRNFFSNQLPKLIQSLQEIAAALSRKAPSIELAGRKDTDILHDLYYGNYEPEPFGSRNYLTVQDQQVMKTEAELKAILPPAAEELFEAYQTAVSARDSAAAEQAYKAGFRLAVQLILAGSILCETSEGENIHE